MEILSNREAISIQEKKTGVMSESNSYAFFMGRDSVKKELEQYQNYQQMLEDGYADYEARDAAYGQ